MRNKLESICYAIASMAVFVFMIVSLMLSMARRNSGPIFVQRSYDNLTRFDLDGDFIGSMTSRSPERFDLKSIAQDPDAPEFFRGFE